MIDVKFEDDKYDPKTTVSAYQNLMLNYKPDIIISASVTNTIIPLAEKDKIPLIATVSSASGIPAQGEYIFRYFTNADTDAPVIAKFAIDELDLETFAVLYVSDEFGVSYHDVFKDEIETHDGEIVVADQIDYGNWDYRTQLTKIKNKNPDAIYIIGIEEQIINAFKQMQTLGMLNNEIKLLSVGTIATPTGVEQIAELGIEVYATAFCTDKIPDEYVSKFMNKYNNYPGFFTTFGYDSVYLIAEASSSEKNIKEGLLNIKGFESTVGEVYSDENGEMWFDI